MYWCAHKTATLTSIQHTVPPSGVPDTVLGLDVKMVEPKSVATDLS
jgi:hypothetical protein